MNPTTMVMAASAAQGLMGFKGNQAAAKRVAQVGEYNARLAEDEAVLLQRKRRDEETALRVRSEYLEAAQNVAAAKSGITLSGSALQALADTKFQTEVDAMRIRYAGDIESAAKESEAAMARMGATAQAQSYKMAALGSILGGVSGVSQAQQQDKMFKQQQAYYKRKLAE